MDALTPVACLHPELKFGSGDFHIFCSDCAQVWTVTKHELANQGNATGLSGVKRAAE